MRLFLNTLENQRLVARAARSAQDVRDAALSSDERLQLRDAGRIPATSARVVRAEKCESVALDLGKVPVVIWPRSGIVLPPAASVDRARAVGYRGAHG